MAQSNISVNEYIPLSWSNTHEPATGTIATTTRTLVSGYRHVCTGIIGSIVSDALAITPGAVQLRLRDSTSGAGTIFATIVANLTATVGDSWVFQAFGLFIPGTTGNAMTLEFNSCPVNAKMAVSLYGYDVVGL